MNNLKLKTASQSSEQRVDGARRSKMGWAHALSAATPDQLPDVVERSAQIDALRCPCSAGLGNSGTMIFQSVSVKLLRFGAPEQRVTCGTRD